MFSTADTVIVAVSGGPDSVFLLHALTKLRHSLGISLSVAHLNHGLRKSASKDQRFVENLARKFQLPFVTRHASITQKHTSLEEAARKARFHFLTETAKRQKGNAIALGHTKDDLAETVLMRILRGSGLYGLRSILPKRKIDGVYFVRPLRDLTKDEILKYLKKNHIAFCIDPTNKNKNFFRNRIRLELLPLLERKYNPDVKNALAHLSETAVTDYDYLEKAARQSAKKIFRHSKARNEISFPLDKFSKLHPSLRRMLLRLAIAKLQGDTRRLTFSHIEGIENLIFHAARDGILRLPRQLLIHKKGKYLSIAVRNS